MTAEQTRAIRELREQGYAITIFNPEELQGADPRRVQDQLVTEGWQVIDILKPQEG